MHSFVGSLMHRTRATEHSDEPIAFDTIIHWDYEMNWAEDNASSATWKGDQDPRTIPMLPTWSHQ